MCLAVLTTIKSLESSVLESHTSETDVRRIVNKRDYSADLNALKGRLHLVDSAYATITSNKWYRHPGVWEISYRMLQAAAMVFLLLVALHELSL